MTKRRPTKPAPDLTLADAPIAAAALGLDVPYYQVRLVGNRLEFHLYGGNVAYWPASDVGAPHAAPSPEESDDAKPAV